MQSKLLSLLNILIPYTTEHQLVRVGADGDGGYMLPDCFHDVSDVISLGISDEISFDLYFAALGKSVYQFDPTVDGPPSAHKNFKFFKEGFGVFEGVMHNTLDSILEKCSIINAKNTLLKFDVEGSEYTGILHSSDEALMKCSIITGEFHALDWCRNSNYFDVIFSVFTKLAKNFTPLHVHANNGGSLHVIDNIPIPSLLEITFIRNDMFKNRAVNLSTKHYLDRKNCPQNSEILWNPSHYFIHSAPVVIDPAYTE